MRYLIALLILMVTAGILTLGYHAHFQPLLTLKLLKNKISTNPTQAEFESWLKQYRNPFVLEPQYLGQAQIPESDPHSLFRTFPEDVHLQFPSANMPTCIKYRFTTAKRIYFNWQDYLKPSFLTDSYDYWLFIDNTKRIVGIGYVNWADIE